MTLTRLRSRKIAVAALPMIVSGLVGQRALAQDLTITDPDPDLFFQDTSGGSSTTGDWTLQGSDTDWLIRDQNNVITVLRLTTGTGHVNSMVVDGPSGDITLGNGAFFMDRSLSYLGLGTTTPSAHLHMVGLSPQPIWESTADGSQVRWEYVSPNFSMEGNTEQNILQANATAPQYSLVIDSAGNIGAGTSTPDGAFHLYRDQPGQRAELIVDNSGKPVGSRSMFRLVNNGEIAFNMDNIATGQTWRFRNGNTGFRISLDGTGGPELEVRNNGNVVIRGTLVENSDVNVKRDIELLDPEAVLNGLQALAVSEWSYEWDGSGVRHIGPMAQDFHAAFGLGEDETKISPRDMAGVAMAAVQALVDKVEAQEQQIVDLERQNGALQAGMERLERLEAQLAAMNERLPGTAATGN